MIFTRVHFSSIIIVMNATWVVHIIIKVQIFFAQNGIITALARSPFEFGMFVRSEFYYPSTVFLCREQYTGLLFINHSTIRLCKVIMRCRQWKSGSIRRFYDNMSLTRPRTIHYIILAYNRCWNGQELCAGKHAIISTPRRC